MRKRLLRLCCAVLVASAGIMPLMAQSSPGLTATDGFVDGVVRVKLQPSLVQRVMKASQTASQSKSKATFVKTGITQLDRVSQQFKVVSIRRVFPYAGKFEDKHKQYGLDRWYDISFSGDASATLQARNLYRAVPGVEKAGRVAVMKPIGGESFRPISPDDIARAAKAASTMPYNDPLLPQQWHYHNDGSIAGTTAGADINAFEAWKSLEQTPGYTPTVSATSWWPSSTAASRPTIRT